MRESAPGGTRSDGLGHLKIKLVEPLQAILVDASLVDGLEDLKNVIDGMRSGLNRSKKRRVVGKHVPW